jgi:Kef-type K+ transport system membrane component KefB
MNNLLVVGMILFFGFIMGEIASITKLPKVTGYIIGGIILNPQLTHIIPDNFISNADIATNMALAFITFSVGGTLLSSKIKKLGKSILLITLFEAEFALLAVVLGFVAIFYIYPGLLTAATISLSVPLAILMGVLASPTDPSATLAVTHEYNAKGEVSSTIMGVAAFDDVFGIINFSLGIAVARMFIVPAAHAFNIQSSVIAPLVSIIGGIVFGIIFGFLINFISVKVKREGDGTLIVIILAMLALCFGAAKHFNVDELLATMTSGVVVVNFNPLQEKIFSVLERYTEELIFIFFFTLSGMHLDLSVISSVYVLIIIFVLLRALGKMSGASYGAFLSHSSAKVKRYTAFGLLPQGGIVIGLALMVKSYKDFEPLSDILIATVIGATVIHELLGPVMARLALKKAGEI